MGVWDSLASGDLIGALLGIYTDVLGPIFGVMISFAVVLPLASRLGWATPILAILIFWGVFYETLPAEALNIGSALIALGIAAIIIVIFWARRRQYG